MQPIIILLIPLLANIHILTLTPKIFLIGGDSFETEALIFQQLAKTVPHKIPQPSKCDQNWLTTICPKIAVATSAATNQAAGNQTYSVDDQLGYSYHSLFKLYGMAPKHLTLHRDNYRVHGNIGTAEGKANLDIIQQADIIFFNGGDQTRHLRSWLNDDGTPNDLLKFIKLRAQAQTVVLAGTSAGSMIWSAQTFGGGDAFGILYFKNSIGLAPKNISEAQSGNSASQDTRKGNDSLQYDHNGIRMKSFGFIDFAVDTHFEARGRLGRLPPVLHELRTTLGIGIDQKTAFYYQNGVGTVYGYNGVTICDMSKAIVPPSPFFTASGIEGSYLTAGDSYDFKTSTVISSKPKIVSPAYNEQTDSKDILGPYQASLLATRLVDQKAVYNLGSTVTPDDFPQGTPRFEIRFYRGGQSSGYQGDSKYTVDRILYDYSQGANLQNNLSVE